MLKHSTIQDSDMNKQKKEPSLIYRLKCWWKKRQHLSRRRRGLIPEVTMLHDGRMILSDKVTKMFGLTESSSVIMYCSDSDCTDLAVSFAPKGDTKGFKVAGGKDGRPYFVRLDKYYTANKVIPPPEDTVCELIDIEQEACGYKIYRILEKASIK